MGSFGGHFGIVLAYGGIWEPYLSQFDVEKSEMASVMGICAGLVGPKSENVKNVMAFSAFLKGSRGARLSQPSERPSEPEHFLVTLGSLFGI